jgi:hypothetical protein
MSSSQTGEVPLGVAMIAFGIWLVAKPSFAADSSKWFFDMGYRSIGSSSSSDRRTRLAFVRTVGGLFVVLGSVVVVSALV